MSRGTVCDLRVSFGLLGGSSCCLDSALIWETYPPYRLKGPALLELWSSGGSVGREAQERYALLARGEACLGKRFFDESEVHQRFEVPVASENVELAFLAGLNQIFHGKTLG